MNKIGRQLMTLIIIGSLSHCAIVKGEPATVTTPTTDSSENANPAGQTSKTKKRGLTGKVTTSDGDLKAEAKTKGKQLKGSAQKTDATTALKKQKADQDKNEDTNVNEPELKSQKATTGSKKQKKGNHNELGPNENGGSNETGGINEPNGNNNQSGIKGNN